jgi:uncharacterized protein YbjT (DUF2867 family)
MKVAVVGGTGLAGQHVVDALQAKGVDAVALSRSGGVDVTTGAGMDKALSDVQRVVDASNAGTTDEAAARAFFAAAGQQLQRAAEVAGVERLVVLSIVGVDRVAGGYMAAKFEHERAARTGAVPTLVLRSTQFHEFAGQVLAWGQHDDVAWVPEMLLQPVAVAAAARVLADLVIADDPAAGIAEVAGPQQEQLVDMATRLAARRGDAVEVRGAPDDSADGRSAATGALLPGPKATIIGPTFEQWLAAGERET